ncbi:hypothetical protein FUAX_18340 [Fulvitalea axinellae]|uniref:Pvc16 N-terminal domain-containing protein n=1 Tax=Fulvitalea axinellae TaxID=1182444 RepID=A0AAU9CN87_9BACT|nr:hypothetical protein FUAX_18340 [Fulvitalea axinellae]
MIDKALAIVAEELNSYFLRRKRNSEGKVILSPLTNQDGSSAVKEQNKVVVSLVDLTEETLLKNQVRFRENSENKIGEVKPSVNLNLHILCSAYFAPANYQESLSYLSGVIAFFQMKPVFESDNTPLMRTFGIERLVFEMQHQDTNSKNNMWNSLGSKYLPSVLYKVRLISFRDDNAGELLPGISGADSNLSS